MPVFSQSQYFDIDSGGIGLYLGLRPVDVGEGVLGGGLEEAFVLLAHLP